MYDVCTLADPVDGDVVGKAILYINADTGIPIVYSQAHGGNCFFLKHNIESLLALAESMSAEQLQDEWSQMLRISELRPDELDRYLHVVKYKTGIGMGALRESVKAATRNAIDAQDQILNQDPGLYLANQLLLLFYKDQTLIQLEAGYYWYYTGKYWSQIQDSVLEGQLQQIATTQWALLLSMWGAAEKKSSTMASLVGGALSCLGSLVVVRGDPLRLNSPHPSVINCENGELWLLDDGPDLRPHRAESYLTSCSPIIYDPTATAPTFEIAMRGIPSLPGGEPMPDQHEMMRHVEELLGYSIQTRRNLKVFVLIVGPGDNGKTKVIKLLLLILGINAIAFDRLAGVNEDGNRFATSRLIGKKALVDDDVDNDYLLPDGLLKKIAEEKPLTAEAKFKDSISFIAQVVPWLLGNSWPKSRDLSRGMQTRAQVMHWPRSFLKPSECGPDHPDRQRPELWDQVYANEMPGVLNRLIAGYYRVAARKDFLPPLSAKQAFDTWLSEANVVARFIAEACVRTAPDVATFTTSQLYGEFDIWCLDAGVQERHRPQQNQFKKRLEDIGLRVKHTDSGTGVYGIDLKSNITHAAEANKNALVALNDSGIKQIKKAKIELCT